jgi:glycosyltransferase involved in cell wall biosynthesis
MSAFNNKTKDLRDTKSATLGVFVGERQNWTFFHDLFEDLNSDYSSLVFRPKTYDTPLLHGRLNRWSLRHGVSSILKRSDVAFFEWASDLLEIATHMPKYCPIVTRLHSFELHAWASLINWDRVDKVILVSEAMRRNFIQEYPGHANKTTVVYNGVRLDRFRPELRDNTLNLGILGSLIPRKRAYEAILTFFRLRERGVAATLHLAGGRVHGPGMDEYYIACHRLVEQLGLKDVVRFYEHIEGTADWLRKIDVFISNSYWEGQQVALLEAMASGCYCLSHCWVGAEEALPPDQVYVTEDELIAKIMAYADLPVSAKHERHATMSRIASEKFDVARQKQEIRAAIESVLISRGTAYDGAVSPAQL